MRPIFVVVGGALFGFGVIEFVVGLTLATTSNAPYNVQMSGRSQAALWAIPTGAGTSLIALGLVLPDLMRSGQAPLSTSGAAAAAVGAVLAIVGLLWATLTACQGFVINYYGPGGDILYQRCQGSISPFPFLAVVMAVTGGALLPLVSVPVRPERLDRQGR